MTAWRPEGRNPLAGLALDTRASTLEALHRLVRPLDPCRSPGGARVRLAATGAVFDQAAADLEGFARPLWGHAAAAAGGDDRTDWAIYRAGLSNGTDPAHPEYWGDIGDLDQRMVELAAIAFALLAVPDRLWTPLDEASKRRVAQYLHSATKHRFSPNNWMFFRLLIDAALRAVGEDVPTSSGDDDRAALDALYLGDGWYRDGIGRRSDHYVGFAFHTYGLLLSRFAPATDRGQHLDRARIFLPQFAAWFDDTGRGLPYGRSMTYRFAMLAAFGAYAIAEDAAEPVLPWGVLKGIVLRHLRWWANQPMADRDGALSVGFAYPNPMIAEDYSSPQSPYWALKAFLPLLLPATHPFWTAPELPLPRPPSSISHQPQPGLVLQHLPDQTVALAAGQESLNFRHGSEKYAKFAYSTRFGFSVEMREATLETAALDGMLGLGSSERGWTPRRGCSKAWIAGDVIFALWHPWPDVTVETWLRPHGLGHLRLHRITTLVPLETVEGGFAVAQRDGAIDQHQLALRTAKVTSTATSLIQDLGATVRTARVHAPAANTNLMVPRSWVPQLIGPVAAGVSELACYCAAGDVGTQLDQSAPISPADVARLMRTNGQRQSIGVLSGTPGR